MDIKDLKAESFDLIREIENLETLKRERIVKVNELGQLIAKLEAEEKYLAVK